MPNGVLPRYIVVYFTVVKSIPDHCFILRSRCSASVLKIDSHLVGDKKTKHFKITRNNIFYRSMDLGPIYTTKIDGVVCPPNIS